MNLKLIFSAFIVLSACVVFAQQPKKKVIENINTWYESHPEEYSLSIQGKEASAIVTRYHPERANEKNDIIEISYKEMRVELKFTKPLNEITTHRDSLQKYFSYVSLVNIYNEIPSDGWKIYPRTPQSSLRKKGVTFISGGDSVSLDLNWAIYTVMGYKDNAKCDKERSIADGVISEVCYVSVDKNIRLKVSINEVPIELF